MNNDLHLDPKFHRSNSKTETKQEPCLETFLPTKKQHICCSRTREVEIRSRKKKKKGSTAKSYRR